MTKFKKLQSQFATKEQAKRQDILVWGKGFWKACKWFYKKGKKEAKEVPSFPRCLWQPIEELTEEHGTVLGRCGNEFFLISKRIRQAYSNQDLVAVYCKDGNKDTYTDSYEEVDAREFMVIPLNNRTEVEISYSAKGLVLGVTWEGVEGVYPCLDIIGDDLQKLLKQTEDILQGKFPHTPSLTGTGDFQRELGAIFVITKSTTIQVNDKPFVNTEVSRELIGNLTAEQMELLDNELNW